MPFIWQWYIMENKLTTYVCKGYVVFSKPLIVKPLWGKQPLTTGKHVCEAENKLLGSLSFLFENSRLKVIASVTIIN